MIKHKFTRSFLLSEVFLDLGWCCWQRCTHDGVRNHLLHGAGTSLPGCCWLLLHRMMLLLRLGVGFLLGVVVGCERAEDRDLLPRGSRLDLLGAAFEEVQRLAGLL